MARLKIYYLADADERNLAIVAARSQREAAQAMDVPLATLEDWGDVVSSAMVSERDTSLHYGAALALATPGVVWVRDRFSVYKWQWVCSDEHLGARAIVRQRFPDAVSLSRRTCWEGGVEYLILDQPMESLVISADWDVEAMHMLASAPTEDDAWLRAAAQLRIMPPVNTPLDAITVWRFRDAPESLRDVSPHGGDEDWLAYRPLVFADEYIPWLEQGRFGCNTVSRHPIHGGDVLIGTH